LAGTGVTVVMTAREVDPERVTTVIRLGDPQAPARPPERRESADAEVIDVDGAPPDGLAQAPKAEAEGAGEQPAAGAEGAGDGEKR